MPLLLLSYFRSFLVGRLSVGAEQLEWKETWWLFGAVCCWCLVCSLVVKLACLSRSFCGFSRAFESVEKATRICLISRLGEQARR
jgi:hypothetical protein